MGTVVIIIILLCIVLLALKNSLMHFKGQGGCCGGADTEEKVKRKKFHNVVAVRKIKIGGMTCDNCRQRVENSLNKLEHVSAKVNLGRQEAVVSLDAMVDDSLLEDAVRKAGYEVISVTDDKKYQ
jgi:copper chaperone CopZ